MGKVNKQDQPRGTLKQAHQQIFHKLLKFWKERGYPVMGPREDGLGPTTGVFHTTIYDLVMYLKGTDLILDYYKVQSLMQDLTAIPIICNYIYQWQNIKKSAEFTLLWSTAWSWKKCEITDDTQHLKKTDTSYVCITFSPYVTEKILQLNIKQLGISTNEEWEKFETARLLYPILDYIAKKPPKNKATDLK